MKENRKNISNVPNLRFPQFSGEWETKKLGEVCRMQAGKFVSASKISDKQNKDLYPCYGGNGLRGYTKSFNQDGMYSLIGRQGALCGNITLADGRFYATEHAVVVTPNKNIDVTWMFYLLTYLNLNQYATGMAQPGLSVKNLEEIEAIFPKVKIEQTKIASFLSLIDERILAQSKIIDRLESLIKGIIQTLMGNSKVKPGWRKLFLRDILTESKELNQDYHPVFSVSVSKGVINQIDYLGRSFAAQNTSNYNVVHFGDIVYTKSPTGKFPYGIVKQSQTIEDVAVSPLYGVYKPKSTEIGNILHHYFNNPINTNNYLHSLVQKGAKNTINITNQNFLNKEISLPIDKNEIKIISDLLESLSSKINLESNLHDKLKEQKQYLLKQMFI